MRTPRLKPSPPEEFAEDDAGEIINLDQPSSSGYTALHLAAMRKHERVVKLLLNEGARVGVVGDDGKTPLHLAAQSGAKAVVKMLLRATKGAAAAVVNDRTNAGETPVLLAAMGGHLDAFDVFMHAGADPFIPDERGNTCMHAACRSGSRDIFVRLLSYASRTHLGMEVFRVPNLAMERPIHLAARNGSVHLVRCLIDRGADLSAGDDHGHNALMAACEADKAGAAALIIDQVKHFGSEVSTDLTMAQMRWRTLKRAMPDLIAADKMGIDPMAENGASEQALIDLSLQRMGISDDGSKMRRSCVQTERRVHGGRGRTPVRHRRGGERRGGHGYGERPRRQGLQPARHLGEGQGAVQGSPARPIRQLHLVN
jgi:ankyrin repeat protein